MPHNFLSYWIASLWRRCSGYGPWGSCSSPAPPTPARRPCGDETADYRLQLSTEGSWARWRNIRIKPNPTQVHDDQAHPVKPCVYWNNLSKTWFIRRQEFAFYGDQKVGCPPYLSLSLPSRAKKNQEKGLPRPQRPLFLIPPRKWESSISTLRLNQNRIIQSEGGGKSPSRASSWNENGNAAMRVLNRINHPSPKFSFSLSERRCLFLPI